MKEICSDRAPSFVRNASRPSSLGGRSTVVVNE